VPLRVMAYHRSFRHIRTHVLCDEPPAREPGRAREQVYAALREGSCYVALDSLGEARGFAFWAEGPAGVVRMGAEARAGPYTLHARLPGQANVRLLRDGEQIAAVHGSELSHELDGPGVLRVEASRSSHGRERTWVLSNPIYLRA
jgi:hypothetical protein